MAVQSLVQDVHLGMRYGWVKIENQLHKKPANGFVKPATIVWAKKLGSANSTRLQPWQGQNSLERISSPGQ